MGDGGTTGGAKGGGGKPKRPHQKLPKGTPKDVVDFVSCKARSITLVPGKQAGITIGGFGPTVTFKPGAGGGVVVNVDAGMASFDLPVSLEGGALKVDTGKLPIGKEAVDSWVKEFNDDLKGRGNEIGAIELKDGKVVIEKQKIGGGKPARAGGGGLKKAAVAGAGAVLLGGTVLGVNVATGGGDDKAESTRPPAAAAEAGAAACDQPLGTGAKLGDQAQRAAALFGDVPYWGDPANHEPCTGFGDPRLVSFPGCGAGCPPVPLARVILTEISHRMCSGDTRTPKGPSCHNIQLDTNFPENWTVTFTEDCAGGQSVSVGMPGRDGVVNLFNPLYQYGTCRPGALAVTGDGTQFEIPGSALFPGPFDVGPQEGPTGGDFGGSLPGIGATDASQAVFDLQQAFSGFTGAEQSIGILPFMATDTSGGKPDGLTMRWGDYSALDLPPLPPTWAFGATSTGSTPAGGTGVLFRQSLFPCGPGRLALTACPEGADVPDDGAFFVAGVLFTEVLPQQPADDTAIGLGVDTDGDKKADRTYTLGADERDWRLSASEPGGKDAKTAARALIRGASVLFVVPTSELGGGVSAFNVVERSGKTQVAIPASDVWVTPAPGAVPMPSAPAGDGQSAAEPADPAAFFEALSGALARKDTEFLFAHLHPTVLEVYGEAACRNRVSSISDVLAGGSVTSVGDPERFDYTVEGRTTTIEDAVPVTITGGDGEQKVVHTASVDGVYRWFTDCGEPL